MNVPRLRKQPVKGKRVGVAFEKKIIKRLGLWWCGDTLSLYRAAGSGSRSTVLGKDAGLYSGDVVPAKASAEPWPFSIELKKSETFTLESILLSRKSLFYSFWKQCTRDAKRSKKIPLLICGKNRREPLVFFYDHMREAFAAAPVWAKTSSAVFHPGGFNQPGVVCVTLTEFVQRCQRTYVIDYAKRNLKGLNL